MGEDQLPGTVIAHLSSDARRERRKRSGFSLDSWIARVDHGRATAEAMRDELQEIA